MKKVILLSHCILNPFCELDEPLTKSLFDSTIKQIVDQGIGILQLPCPELCFQSLERESITDGDYRVEGYRVYLDELLRSVVKNIKEYHENGIELVKLVGIETSPSCSAVDPSSIMMKQLKELLDKENISIPTIDMPHIFSGDEKEWIVKLLC